MADTRPRLPARPAHGHWRPLVAAVGVALVLAGCATTGPALSPQQLQSKVSDRVFDALNAWGLPVVKEAISCEGPLARGAIDCYGLTDNSPPGDVTARFVPSGGSYRRSGCPGPLSVSVSNTVLTKLTADPCR